MLKQASIILCLGAALLLSTAAAPQPSVKIARLQYDGGGDWYVGPTSLPNLIAFCNTELGTTIAPQQDVVTPSSPALFTYPFIYLTGHGNIKLSDADATNLREYLLGGGFLFINDSYGLDPFIQVEMKKVLPELSFVELPYNHPIFSAAFTFKNGLPKIHEHEGKPPQGFGLIYKGRVVCFYAYESDIGDGWEDPAVHNDPPEKHQQALRMGANLITYAFIGEGE